MLRIQSAHCPRPADQDGLGIHLHESRRPSEDGRVRRAASNTPQVVVPPRRPSFRHPFDFLPDDSGGRTSRPNFAVNAKRTHDHVRLRGSRCPDHLAVVHLRTCQLRSVNENSNSRYHLEGVVRRGERTVDPHLTDDRSTGASDGTVRPKMDGGGPPNGVDPHDQNPWHFASEVGRIAQRVQLHRLASVLSMAKCRVDSSRDRMGFRSAYRTES